MPEDSVNYTPDVSYFLFFSWASGQWRPYMEAKGAFATPVFFSLPLFEILTSVKIDFHGFYTLPLMGFNP